MSYAYEKIGVGYATTRGPDPRIEAQINAALGDAGSVANIGAGGGSYEPRDRFVYAVEPSPTMGIGISSSVFRTTDTRRSDK